MYKILKQFNTQKTLYLYIFSKNDPFLTTLVGILLILILEVQINN